VLLVWWLQHAKIVLQSIGAVSPRKIHEIIVNYIAEKVVLVLDHLLGPCMFMLRERERERERRPPEKDK
jgi:hypothetical protein